MTIRRQVRVSGLVQGVGFRPYVYRLARERSLGGTVRNTPAGVEIEIEGADHAVEAFIACLGREAPPLAQVAAIEISELACNPQPPPAFTILPSAAGARAHTAIAADAATCPECLRELFDPRDRRYLYPFLNCTHCGPRFTIVRGLPYDRARTSMAEFTMCPACQAEYDDPANRRFHAQPNACWDCGPRLEWRQLGDATGGACVPLDFAGAPLACRDPLAAAIAALRAGLIVAVKGLGGFHLALDAANPAAVALLRRRKHREEKPFAVMVPDLDAAAQFAELNPAAAAALQSPQRPIVLLPRPSGSERLVAAAVAPGQPELGVFLPYTPLHHLLFALGGFQALVMTSANLSEEPICIDNAEAISRLQGIADGFLLHNRAILRRCDDAVVRVHGNTLRQIRRSRGWVPQPLKLPRPARPLLAVGGELKNTVCLARGDEAFLSQHIGDLENPQACDFFVDAARHLQRILEIEPELVAYDLHPDYFSTRWALTRSRLPSLGVQHHHAHVAACMAEHGLEGRVIGLALDGTGYGLDGTVWGGEALIADYAGFERAGHLEPVAMPGGEAAIRQPWRMAFAYLAQTFGDAALDLDLDLIRRRSRRSLEVLLKMIARHFNAPLTSSCGRLFDAVAALVGARDQITFEAQAAMNLEALAAEAPATVGAYPFDLKRSSYWVLDPRPLFAALIDDVRRGVPPPVMARRFHLGLARALAELAERIALESGLSRICLGGGCCNNLLLLDSLQTELGRRGFEVFAPVLVPAGDGGLSYGQAAVAAAVVPD